MYNGISAMVCKITYLLQNELHMSEEKEKRKKKGFHVLSESFKSLKKNIGIAIS